MCNGIEDGGGDENDSEEIRVFISAINRCRAMKWEY